MRTAILLFVTAALAAGCSSSTTSSDGFSNGDTAGRGGGGGYASDPSSGGTTGASGSSSGGLSTGHGGGGAAGVLTAGMWDDNLNYDFFGKYLATARQPGDPGFTTADFDAAHAEFAQRSGHATLDAALVIDTTGSMGDELAYLTAEFANITTAIDAKFPGAQQRWALVLYKDTVDAASAYIVRTFDFTSDISQFKANIGAQSAGGGGDYPESDEKGLAALPQLHWRRDPSVAHIAFWVGDAPHHVADAAAMKSAITGAHGAGIHLYPVSASGTDSLLELTMRSAALVTGGRYMFLTDDSGVGDPHKQPEIPCYSVTKLQSALVRAAAMELSGTEVPLDPTEVIRTVGSPSATGQCQLSDGQTVQAL